MWRLPDRDTLLEVSLYSLYKNVFLESQLSVAHTAHGVYTHRMSQMSVIDHPIVSASAVWSDVSAGTWQVYSLLYVQCIDSSAIKRSSGCSDPRSS